MRTRREFLLLGGGLLAAARRPPNFVIILTDDQGYADLGSYGAEGFSTPRLDRMAAEGVRFTEFYSAPICTPARAALLTGCYPIRVGLTRVLGVGARNGISAAEKLIPEVLHEIGYRTAIFGKWHLGREEKFLPLQHGFDEFFGTPGSNDMGSNMDLAARRAGKAGVELMEGNKVVELDPDQSLFTRRYTERAVDFIRRNRQRPFFLYLAHNMPHTPIFASDRFRGKTRRGLYGDVVEEIDWSVGEVLDALRREGLEDNTLLFFTSDNGPWLIFGDHGGSAKPLRGGKKQTLEGGLRVPALARWPGRIHAGRTCAEIVTAMDLLPTITHLAGGKLPAHKIDGLDIWPLLAGEPVGARPRDTFYYYYEDELRGVRKGRWKLQLPHTDSQAPDPKGIGMGGVRGQVFSQKFEQALYDIEADPGETTDLSAKHSQVVKELLALAESVREELGCAITHRKGHGVRPSGGS